MNIKVVFYKVISLISKDYFENPISILHYANKALGPIHKVFMKIRFIFAKCFLTVLKYCVNFLEKIIN
jgi:hypothetical protein